MDTIQVQQIANKPRSALSWLKLSGAVWLTVAILGQGLFAFYILMFYGGHALEANWQAWSNRMIHGIIEGDYLLNAAVFIHILLAFTISGLGPLQFVPQIRTKFPMFHRINGRFYLTSGVIISVSAIYMIWSREAIVGGLPGQIGTSLDGILVIIFAFITVRFAMARKIKQHSRWALRFFIVVSGVWFYRIIRGFWIIANNGTSPGTNANLTGPFDITLNFAGYLVPLLILEVYFYLQDHNKPVARKIFSIVLCLLTLVTAIGIYGAAKILWLPNL
ncbi:DUF2306 domain-containing protein [Thalassotalea fusca]